MTLLRVTEDHGDILTYYAAFYRPEMIDLSSSAAPPDEDLASLVLGEADGDYVPPTGAEELRQMVAARYRTLSAENIVLCAGASEGLVALAHALVAPGHEVYMERGTYPSFAASVERLRATVVDRPEDAQVVSVCRPTVPGGHFPAYPRLSSRTRTFIVDEVQLAMTHDDDGPDAAADMGVPYVSVNSLSKSLGLGGVRIGWVASHDADLLHRVDREVQLLSGGPSAPSVASALAVLPGFDEHVDRVRRSIRANMPAVQRALDDLGWHANVPSAGLTLEAQPPAPVAPAAEARLREEGYFLLPGRLYGSGDGYRVSLLADADQLRHALAILGG